MLVSIRQFNDDDVRVAADLLSRLTTAEIVAAISIADRLSSNQYEIVRTLFDRLDGDVAAIVQLIVITDSFREMLGVKCAQLSVSEAPMADPQRE